MMKCEIKKLEWKEDADNGIWFAYGVARKYRLLVNEGGKMWLFKSTWFGKLKDAMADAQTHHEIEVMKYLNVPTQEDLK